MNPARLEKTNCNIRGSGKCHVFFTAGGLRGYESFPIRAVVWCLVERSSVVHCIVYCIPPLQRMNNDDIP